ncbi:MAG: phosphatidate cytidylyltransferase [Chloroflexi bacterium]|nr:phosphatidate cytidylyltransferase [Chloroflexota bacterium]
MLKQRVLSALVMLPVVLGAAWLGGWWFTAFIALVAALATWEALHLVAQTEHEPFVHFGAALAALLVLESALPPDALRLQILIVAAVLLGLTRMLTRRTPRPANDWILTLGAAIYLGVTLRFTAMLRDLPAGLAWVGLTAITVWVMDSGAYFIGKRFGRHKMAPRISPKKTWEGFFGGLLTGTLAATALSIWLMPNLPWYGGALVGVVIGLVGPLGDLSESVLKRQVGAKDSSNLIPGHGGVLDRIDSFIFAGPVVYILALWLLG